MRTMVIRRSPKLVVLIAKTIGVPCYVADNPAFCVVKGTGIVLENLEVYKRSIVLAK